MTTSPTEITIYGRAGCHLCEEARAKLEELRDELGEALILREIDIESDPSLAIYGNDVPVGFVQDQEVFRHRVDVKALLERIRDLSERRLAAEPLDSEHDLAAEQCVPCRGGVPPLSEEVAAKLLGQLADGWRLVSNHHLERSWTFPDFRRALAFTNQIGDLAELQGHHPDITLKWGSVAVVIWTHAIDGLTRSDFVLAAKIDGLARI